jgi:hypothetical protein
MLPTSILALCLLPLALAAPAPAVAPLNVAGEVADGYIVVLKKDVVAQGLMAFDFDKHLGEVEAWNGNDVSTHFP